MEVMGRSCAQVYGNSRIRLSELLRSESLPRVIKICDTSNGRDVGLVGDLEMLIQAKVRVKFARVRVLEFDDRNQVVEKKGAEFCDEHDTMIGKEFLIPSKYDRSMRFIHRPNGLTRYTSVLQVLHEMPRYVTVCEDTVAFPANGIGKNIIVSSNTKLEIVRRVPMQGVCFMECHDGTRTMILSEKDKVNFTEHIDGTIFQLADLTRYTMLPKAFTFTDVQPIDIIDADDELYSSLWTVLSGPLDLLDFTDVELLIGWVRDRRLKTYKTVLIPETLWQNVVVRVRRKVSDKSFSDYVKRKYPSCDEAHFVEHLLYSITPELTRVTFLRSPNLFKRSTTSSSLFDIIKTDFNESSDSDVEGDYIDAKEILNISLDKTKVGNEDEPLPLPPRRHKEKVIAPSQTVHSDLLSSRETDVLLRGPQSHSHNIDNNLTEHLSSTPQSKTSDSVPLPCTPHSHTYPGAHKGHHDSGYLSLTTPKKGETCSPVAISHTDGTISSNESDDEYVPMDRPGDIDITPVVNVREYTELTTASRSAEQQFFKYSINEATECFRLCGLGDFANKCLENKLDGAFFENFDLEELKNEPFYLTRFDIVKVKKVIYEGWRIKGDKTEVKT